MKTVSISELKTHLSRYLDRIKAGEEVVVTDRGRPVARLTPVEGSEGLEGRMQQLVREGRLRPPRRPPPSDLRSRDVPEDPEGRSLAYLLEERREGR